MQVLAQSGAFDRFDPNRRRTLWHACNAEDTTTMLSPEYLAERQPAFSELNFLENIAWDYRIKSHSTVGHPLEPFRDWLDAKNYPTASQVRSFRNGSWIRYLGVAICRQSPKTAAGVVFITLEDETGFVNLILWPKVFETYRTIVKTSACLGVSGKLQFEEGVLHIIASKLWTPDFDTSEIHCKAREFR